MSEKYHKYGKNRFLTYPSQQILGAFAKMRKVALTWHHVCPSVRTRLSLGGFSLNLKLEKNFKYISATFEFH
jgi:hypothetical protein